MVPLITTLKRYIAVDLGFYKNSVTKKVRNDCRKTKAMSGKTEQSMYEGRLNPHWQWQWDAAMKAHSHVPSGQLIRALEGQRSPARSSGIFVQSSALSRLQGQMGRELRLHRVIFVE